MALEINIDHHFTSKVYTTGSIVDGHVSVAAELLETCDAVDICLVGIGKKRLELSHFSTRNPADWRFLNMRMPRQDIPTMRASITEGDQLPHRIPFRFVIPEHLTIEACKHDAADPQLHERHIRLPPTMGSWDACDMSPHVAAVEYYVKAYAHGCRSSPRSGDERRKITESCVMIRVLPATPEEAPLLVTPDDEQFCTSQVQGLRQNLLGRGTGQLRVEAEEPACVMLSPDGLCASQTSLHMRLRFLPCLKDGAPPNLKGVSGRIISNTFFSPSMLDCWPHLGSRMKPECAPILNHTVAVPVFSVPLCMDGWREADPSIAYQEFADDMAAVSASSDGHRDQEKKGQRTWLFQGDGKEFVKDLRIPFTIPMNAGRTFLPTFHSCLFSRTYTLQLCTSPGFGLKDVTVLVPLQIGVQSLDTGIKPTTQHIGTKTHFATVGVEVELNRFR